MNKTCRTMKGSETNRLCRSHFLWKSCGSRCQHCPSLPQTRQHLAPKTKITLNQGLREIVCVRGSVHVCRSGTRFLEPAVSFWRPKIHKEGGNATNKTCTQGLGFKNNPVRESVLTTTKSRSLELWTKQMNTIKTWTTCLSKKKKKVSMIHFCSSNLG